MVSLSAAWHLTSEEQKKIRGHAKKCIDVCSWLDSPAARVKRHHLLKHLFQGHTTALPQEISPGVSLENLQGINWKTTGVWKPWFDFYVQYLQELHAFIDPLNPEDEQEEMFTFLKQKAVEDSFSFTPGDMWEMAVDVMMQRNPSLHASDLLYPCEVVFFTVDRPIV